MDSVNYEKMNIQWFPGHMTKALIIGKVYMVIYPLSEFGVAK